MPIDPSIALSVRPIQLDDPLEKRAKIQAMQLNGIQVAQAQREESQQRTLADLYRGNTGTDGKVNNEGMLQGMAQAGLGARIPGFQKQMLDTQKTQADLGKTGIETDAMKFKLDKDRLNASNGMLASLLAKPDVTHDDVINGIVGIVQRGLATREQGQMLIKSLPGRPEELRPYLMQKGIEGMDEAKRMELLTPKFEKMDLGGTVQTGTVNQLTGQFSPNGKATPKVVSPDAVLSSKTSTANNRAGIAAQYAINGLGPDGTPGGDIQTTARLIAEGKIAFPERALNTPRGQHLARLVTEINPDYDSTTMAAKRKAAGDFASGSLGSALRSVSTANMHLEQLSGMVDALDNGDYTLINKARNAYQAATGKTAPTDFDGIKQVVGQEVVKAVVANGGSAGEREEAATSFSNARSKEQLKSLMGKYRMVMQAQADNLMEQRRAAGLPDSTLPKYNQGHGDNGGSSLPPDVAAALKKHGSK